jgi:membrane associated rhomboid family serine protease
VATPTRRKPRSLGRLRHGEIPGIAPDRRPYATMALVTIALATFVLRATGQFGLYDLGGIFFSPGNQWWRLVAAPFLHDSAGYAFITLTAVAIFGSSLERRFGWYAPLFVFLLAGAAGAGLAVATSDYPAWGANGAALGLLTAWYVEYRLTRNDGEVDLLGAAVLACVLILLSVAWIPASLAAAVGGSAMGALAGFALAQRAR